MSTKQENVVEGFKALPFSSDFTLPLLIVVKSSISIKCGRVPKSVFENNVMHDN